MTIAAPPPTAAPAPTVPTTRTAVPAAHDPIPAAPAAVPETPAAIPETSPAASTRLRRWSLPGGLTPAQTYTAAAIVAAALALAGIGLYLSFEHVAVFAHDRLAFTTLGKAQLFTVGVDVGILVLIALDLLMAWLRRPIGWVRFPVWLLTGATIVLNAASAAPEAGAWTAVDYVAAFAHAVVPVLFIAVVEIGKTAIDRVVRPDRPTDGVPLSRWLLSPGPTFALWRRMKLWAVASYQEAVARERALTVYRVLLEKRYGSTRRAPAEERLPLTMAPYGLTIDEALDLPRQQEEREKTLADAKKAAEVAAKEREAERAAQAEIAALKRQGAVKAAQSEVAALTGQAEAQAQAQISAAERLAQLEEKELESAVVAEARARKAEAERREAQERKAQAIALAEAAELERQAQMEKEALDSAVAAEARARKAEAERKEAEARKAAAEADREAAELERQAAETRKAAAEADRIATAEAQAVETQAVAEARKAAAEADSRAAEIEKAAAETRRAAAEADRRAAEEDARRKAAIADAKAAERRAAEAERAAAEARRAAAEIELRAVEVEDAAHLKPSERAARRVARLALAEVGGQAEALTLERIAEVLGVSISTASERRREAAELLAAGYRPEGS